MRLFHDHAHVLLALPFIPVIFANHIGSFSCLWANTYTGMNGSWFFMEPSMHVQEGFVTFCFERVVLKGPLEWSIRNLLFV
jgi:hypothetical protein